MLAFTNCKINIGLRITGKRPDGYHNLETVFLPIPWHDALEIIEAPELSLQMSGLAIPGNPQDNLCLKAWHLLKKDHANLPPVHIHLHKCIPAGAGVGGGSSNGAHMLSLLNTKFQLGLSNEQLAAYALQLGSDCPFFIHNQMALATGRGEVLHTLEHTTPLSGLYLLIVNPGVHVPTGWAFGQIQPALTGHSWWQAMQHPVEEWQARGIINDFEAPVSGHWPQVQQVLHTLRHSGALFAAMTGTGSTCYAFFREDPDALMGHFPEAYLTKVITL